MSETPIFDMVKELMVEGASNEVILIAIRGAELSAMSGGCRVDTPADKRRAWDREYRRNKRNSNTMSGGIHPTPPDSVCPPLIEERKKEVSKKDSRRGTRCPPDWTPEQADLNFAVCHLSEAAIENEVIKFRNYWTAKSGKDATKLNWGRTWQNWVLNAKERNHGNGHRKHKTVREVGEQLIAELHAADRTTHDAERSDSRGDANAFSVSGNGHGIFAGVHRDACADALRVSQGDRGSGMFADPRGSEGIQIFPPNGRSSR